ncbi:endopeptidase IV, partial [Rubrivivax gelatinosus]|nr:endopeptidase IV [Rubrivivax gelatinosus]
MQTDDTLERALREAATDPARRPAFFELLLQSTVFVVGRSEGPAGEALLAPGEGVALQEWRKGDGTSVIPFFTTLKGLQRATPRDVPYLAMAARGLFELTRGATLTLDPMSVYGKEFAPDEVAALLRMGADAPMDERVLDREVRVTIGQPAQLPTEMLEALRRHFSGNAQVRAAYLALMRNPADGEDPRFVVGIAGDGDVRSTFKAAGAVVEKTIPAGMGVDFT